MQSTGQFGKRHFNTDKQRAFIEGHGVTVEVVPTLSCPCLTAQGQFNPLDPHCRGTGRWEQPALAYTTTLLLVDERHMRKYTDVGTWVAGSLLAVTPPGVVLADRDVVRMMDERDTFNDEILVRGSQDKVRFQVGTIIDLVADFTQTYMQGTDYVLTPPATIGWLPGQGPDIGTQYAVKYRAFSEWLVFNDLPGLRVEGHVPQSQHVRLMRLDKLHTN